jgi:hypothetical protein
MLVGQLIKSSPTLHASGRHLAFCHRALSSDIIAQSTHLTL